MRRNDAMLRDVGRRSGEGHRTKRCPRCGQVLFADMDVCYGCLYNFSKHEDEAPLGYVVPDDWDAGMPPYELTDDTSLEASGGLNCLYGLRIRDASLEVVVPLLPSGITIGRADGCDVMLRSPSVSRQHVRLESQGGAVIVTDLGSTNHALLDGVEVTENTKMGIGSTLDVCGVLLTLTQW